MARCLPGPLSPSELGLLLGAEPYVCFSSTKLPSSAGRSGQGPRGLSAAGLRGPAERWPCCKDPGPYRHKPLPQDLHTFRTVCAGSPMSSPTPSPLPGVDLGLISRTQLEGTRHFSSGRG